ncbi:MAG: chemotaxis protein CheY [Friedmanniella sp.]|nr:chemotaxis protein CheY [Friedmanniella sp.]
MTSPRALLVEDTAEFVLLGRRLLEGEGYTVSVAGDGLTALQMARETRPELILLDVSLPRLDGLEVCRRLREFTDAYVIMLTARREEVDKLLGLAVGADDYVTKPFSTPELTLRIKAMRRRPRQPLRKNIWDFGDLVVDLDSREAHLSGELLDLTRTEFDLLRVLSEHPRQTHTRRQLLTEVWGSEWFGDDHLVDVHLANLRRKLKETAAAPRHLRTLRGVGYRFDP